MSSLKAGDCKSGTRRGRNNCEVDASSTWPPICAPSVWCFRSFFLASFHLTAPKGSYMHSVHNSGAVVQVSVELFHVLTRDGQGQTRHLIGLREYSLPFAFGWLTWSAFRARECGQGVRAYARGIYGLSTQHPRPDRGDIASFDLNTLAWDTVRWGQSSDQVYGHTPLNMRDVGDPDSTPHT